MRLTTGEQLAALAGLVPQYETVAENWTVAHDRIAELEALLDECRLSLCPFDCKLLLARIDAALAKKELSE